MDCSICLDRPDGRVRLRCGHVFCRGCIEEWYINTEEPACPNCRRRFTFKHLDEARGSRLEDKLFGELIEDLDSDFIMEEMFYIQSTIKALKELNVSDDDIRECCEYGEWYLWKPFETRRSPIYWETVLFPPVRKAITRAIINNNRHIPPIRK